MDRRNVIDIAKLIMSIAICLFAGFIGSVFTIPSITTWYASLQKPSFNPPNWVFAPVWTILFVLMGISLFLVWKRWPNKEVKTSLSIFSIQLVLNVLWSLLFFELHSPFYAFVDIVILWAAIALTIYYFSRVSRIAGLLLLPYIIWVSFAAILNFFIMMLNP